MPYVGDKLQPLFTPRLAKRTARRLLARGGDEIKDRIAQNTPVDLGHLRKSWKRLKTEAIKGTGGLYDVGTILETDIVTEVDYAPHVEWGTGIYGPSGAPYEIKPRDPNGVLSWVDRDTGNRIYATRVMHPGSPGVHMVAAGIAKAEVTMEAAVGPTMRLWVQEQEAHARAQ